MFNEILRLLYLQVFIIRCLRINKVENIRMDLRFMDSCQETI